MGRSVSIDTTASYGLLNGYAGNTITAGDLVVLSESGYFVSPSAATPIANLNQTVAGPIVQNAITTILQTNLGSFTGNVWGYRGSGFGKSSTVLSNGNFAFAYLGYNNAGLHTSNIQIRSSFGNLIYDTSSTLAFINSVSNQNRGYQLLTIGSDRIAYVGSYSTTPYFAIRNNDGSVAVASTNLTGTMIGSQQYNQMASCALANGNFVAVWQNTSSGLVYAIYNPSGSAVLSTSVIEGLTGSVASPAIALLSNGDFVVTWFSSTYGYRFARYNQAGTLQGGIVTVSGNLAAPASQDTQADNVTGRIFALSNGGFVVWARDPSASNHIYYVRDASGNAVTSFTIPSSGWGASSFVVSASGPSSVATYIGGFAILVHASTYAAASYPASVPFCVAVYDNAANLISQIAVNIPSLTINSSTALGGLIASRGTGGFAIAALPYESNNTNFTPRIFTINASGSILGSVLNPNPSNGTYADAAGLDLNTDGVMQFYSGSGTSNSTTYLYSGNHKTQRSSVFGVATEFCSVKRFGHCSNGG